MNEKKLIFGKLTSTYYRHPVGTVIYLRIENNTAMLLINSKEYKNWLFEFHSDIPEIEILNELELDDVLRGRFITVSHLIHLGSNIPTTITKLFSE